MLWQDTYLLHLCPREIIQKEGSNYSSFERTSPLVLLNIANYNHYLGTAVNPDSKILTDSKRSKEEAADVLHLLMGW